MDIDAKHKVDGPQELGGGRCSSKLTGARTHLFHVLVLILQEKAGLFAVGLEETPVVKFETNRC